MSALTVLPKAPSGSVRGKLFFDPQIHYSPSPLYLTSVESPGVTSSFHVPTGQVLPIEPLRKFVIHQLDSGLKWDGCWLGKYAWAVDGYAGDIS